MFKVKNKDTRPTSVTSFWCLYRQLWTCFTPFSSDILLTLSMNLFAGKRDNSLQATFKFHLELKRISSPLFPLKSLSFSKNFTNSEENTCNGVLTCSSPRILLQVFFRTVRLRTPSLMFTLTFAKISCKQLFCRPRLDNDSGRNSFMAEFVFQYDRELCQEKVITLNWFSNIHTSYLTVHTECFENTYLIGRYQWHVKIKNFSTNNDLN